MKTLAPLFASLVLAACATMPAGDEPAVVPEAERARAHELNVAGPRANKGIEAIKPLGQVPLKDEFPGAGSRVLRVREITVAPGGVVAVHRHDGRPGVAYILEGEMTEFRGADGAPGVKSSGAVAFEQTGVTHWWENRGKTRARALVVDIVSGE